MVEGWGAAPIRGESSAHVTASPSCARRSLRCAGDLGIGPPGCGNGRLGSQRAAALGHGAV